MEIREQHGGATLHRITSSNTRGEEHLESAGRHAMLGPEDMAVDENAGDVSGAHEADVVRLVTMNVAGLCDELGPAGVRMDEILTKLLADEEPDVLCFQEVTDEMYRERSARIPKPSPKPAQTKSIKPSPSNHPFKPSLQTFPSNIPFNPQGPRTVWVLAYECATV